LPQKILGRLKTKYIFTAVLQTISETLMQFSPADRYMEMRIEIRLQGCAVRKWGASERERGRGFHGPSHLLARMGSAGALILFAEVDDDKAGSSLGGSHTKALC
jgi:hypothetical protein